MVAFNGWSAVTLLIGLPVLYVIFRNALSRSQERTAGRHRCAYCRGRLKKRADRAGWASVCPKCGRNQPWG